jgi:quercetin dioxygenase-like cupin family protein
MKIENFSPISFDWSSVAEEKAPGDNGFTMTKTKMLGEIRVRVVEFSPDYIADHWCDKGHVIYVLEGQLQIDYKDGNTTEVSAGMSYFIGDNSLTHFPRSGKGAKVLIID